MKAQVLSAALALAAVACAEQSLQQLEPRHEGTPVPVTVYQYDGYDAYDYTTYKYNYHSNRYYRSNSGSVDGVYGFDQTQMGYTVSDPWTGRQDGFVSSRWDF